MKAIGYIRVSTQGQVDDGVSLEAQKSRIEAWCLANNYELAGVFSDRGISGAVDIDKRPGLLSALDAAKSHKADSLIMVKRDRLARDTLVAGMVERLFSKLGTKVITTDGAGNGDNPEDVLLRGIQDVFAQYERMLITFRTKAALAHKKAKGERVGTIPYGFSVADDGIVLVEDIQEQSILKDIQSLRRDGYKLREIAEELNNQGLLTRRGSEWRVQYIHNLLRAA
jgi:site-specific DNA recombinase